MLNFIGGLLTDVALFGGIIMFFMSFSGRFKENRKKILITAVILIAVGKYFFDLASLSEAYQNGAEFGKTVTSGS